MIRSFACQAVPVVVVVGAEIFYTDRTQGYTFYDS